MEGERVNRKKFTGITVLKIQNTQEIKFTEITVLKIQNTQEIFIFYLFIIFFPQF